MRVALPPGCFGLENRENGRVYADAARADRAPHYIGKAAKRRQRSVEITNPAHLQAVKENPLLNNPGFYLNADGWDCACGHGCWIWQDACPRCGAERPARGV